MQHVLGISSCQSERVFSKRFKTPTFAGFRVRFLDCPQYTVAAPSRRNLNSLATPRGSSQLLPETYVPTRGGKAIKLVQAIARSKAKTPRRIPRGINHSYSKMKSYVEFITTPTADTPGTALLLHFDDKRYLIGNIHEGLQRAGLQVGAKFLKAKDFFITGRTEWRSTGGLMGMILTLADATTASAAARAEVIKLKLERRKAREEEDRQRKKKPSKKASSDSLGKAYISKDLEVEEEDSSLTLHGGPNLTHTIATARRFIFRKGTPVRVHEHHQEQEQTDAERSWEPTWADKRIRVWAMPIAPSENNDNSRDLPRETHKKRSLGEFMTGEPPAPAEVPDQWSTEPNAPKDQAKRDQELREFIVNEMFSSEWRYDALVELPLHEVKLPASIFARDLATKKIEKYTGPLPDGTTPVPNVDVLVRQPWPGAMIDHLPPTKPSSIAMSYIIRNHRIRGKFRPATAKELNVPPGPLWAALAAGSEVQSKDGKTITPDMVLESSKEGGGVAVVELPSRDYVANLVNRPEWKAEKIMTGVGAIVWILGPGVADDDTLSAFISARPTLNHIISSTDHCPNYLAMTAAATSAIRHSLIDPTRYPIPIHYNEVPRQSLPDTPASQKASDSSLLAKRGLRIQLEPSFAVTESNVVPHLNTRRIIQETPREVLQLGQAAQQEVQSNTVEAGTANIGLPSQDAEIICLGTGSAIPSLHRNVSGTLLRVPGCGSYLLDCGENTLGQLKRIFTQAQLKELFHDLKLIWISHLHADHHLGTTPVIKAWYEEVHGTDPGKPRPSLTQALLAPGKSLERGKRLFVVGHVDMLRWLEDYSTVEDYGYSQIIPLETRFNMKNHDYGSLEWYGVDVGFNTSKDPAVRSAISRATGLTNLVTVPVSHCHGAQAISLTFPTGFKFSYSGDCRPSKAFARMGKGSTVLLHEATFDDELQGDAMAKKHSTTSEALGVGKAMGAKRVLLTHFSQRYQKIPSMSAMTADVELEDREDDEDPMDHPIEGIESNFSPTPQVTTTTKTPPPPNQANPPSAPSASNPPPTSTNPTTNTNTSNPGSEMKIGVAFDYMRVKVKDIIHLEKFNGAMRELYKDAEAEEEKAKVKVAAKEAFSDGIVGEKKNGKGGRIEKGGKGEKRRWEEKYEERRWEDKPKDLDLEQGEGWRQAVEEHILQTYGG